MGHITQDHLKQSKIVIPPMEYIERLDVKIMPILAKKIILEEESLRLTQLRDWLLPMLMNGQVTVTEAREMVEELMVAEPSVGWS